MRFKNLFLTLIAVFLPLTKAIALPSRIIIIRHAEKPKDPNDPHLSEKGFERAKAMVHLFDTHPEYADHGLPEMYFASKFIQTESANRAVETITPLAAHFGKSVNQQFEKKETKRLASFILQNSELNNKVVMIAWTHQNIPDLAKNFGCESSPKDWPGDDVFDRVWILDFISENNTTKIEFKDVPQNLLDGDSN